MTTAAVLRSLGFVLPEILVGAFILVVIVADLFPRRGKGAPSARLGAGGAWLAFLGLAAAGYFGVRLWRGGAPPEPAFDGAYQVDRLGTFFKVTFLGASLLVGLFSARAIREWRTGKGEFFALLLSCTFGMMLMAGANDMLLMYLSLEFVSITSYIMSGLLRKNRKSSEASLKYIIYGAGASGFMIYGMTFLYGLTGSLQVGEVGARLALLPPQPTMTLITSVLVMAGFAYKIAAVPFHMWCPDVYEGAPTPVTAFFSVGPKAAGFVMLARFLNGVYPETAAAGAFEWKLVIALLAVLTMAVGNFAAIHQQNLKRLFAYSSIAHAGYMLVAFTAFTPDALAGVAFYVVAYVLMNLGAFLVVIVLEERYGVETVDGCRGLGWKAPALGGLMTVFLLSLTGIPPTAGFVGKVLVFYPVISYGIDRETELRVALVVIAMIFSVISLFYYARIIAAMFLVRPRDEGAPAPPMGFAYGSILWLLAGGTLLLGVWWSGLQGLALEGARTLIVPK